MRSWALILSFLCAEASQAAEAPAIMRKNELGMTAILGQKINRRQYRIRFIMKNISSAPVTLNYRICTIHENFRSLSRDVTVSTSPGCPDNILQGTTIAPEETFEYATSIRFQEGMKPGRYRVSFVYEDRESLVKPARSELDVILTK